MAFYRLWTQDIASGQYTLLSQSTEYGTAIYSVDGDPSTIWYLNATTGKWEHRPGVTRAIRAFAVANHNWAGRTITFADSPDGSAWTNRVIVIPATNADFLVPFSTVYSAPYQRVSVSGGTEDAYAGIVSLLADYDETGSGEGNGYGILTMGDQGMLRDPIGRGLVPAVGVGQTVGGLELTQNVSKPFDILNLDVAAMRAGTGLEWYRVRKSYEGSNANFPNPSWSKGVWVSGDEAVDNAANEAWYCHPTAGLDDPVSKGRVSSVIGLRTRSRGV